jgi:hypothetical protein
MSGTIIPKEPNWYNDIEDPVYDITVFWPSRGRPDFTRETMKRAFDKSSKKNKIQAIVRVDRDDPFLGEYVNEIKLWENSSLIIGSRLHGYESTHVFYDECARLSIGKLMWLLNDDGWIDTENWDQVIIDFINKHYKNDVFICSFDCRNIDGKGKAYDWAFPIMSRKMFNLLGKFCYGDVKYIDTILRYTGDYLGSKQIPVRVIHQHVWDIKSDETSREGCLAAYKWMGETGNKIAYKMMERLGKEIADILRPYMINE